MEAFENKAVPNREIILKTNSKTQKKTVVHSDVTKYLKNHQVDGIKFMFENCFEQNSGCILAHCMGLGKTLQVIALLHAVINSKEYKTNKILVLCPISTIMNWKEEILRWLGSINDGHRKLQILELGQKDNIDRKITFLQNWSQCDSESPAICLIMGYDSFRNLVNFHTTKANAKKYKESSLRQIRDRIRKYLLAPADIVICDEGHVIKNSTAGITLAVNQIETKRRIVLTGTPMQNHLMEYYSMVNFVRPSFLGSRQHFAEYFADPIKSGQHADSCVTDIKHMKQRSYALHKKLSKIVQRREISLLKDFLPEKFEFVLFIPLTHIQYDLYKYFLANRGGVIEAKRLFGDYTCLRKIWTHLKVLDNAHQKSVAKKRRTTNVDDGSNDDDADEEYGPSGALQMVDNDWWRKAIDKKQLENASSSHKMIILFEILNECKRVGDKCVIFSSFVEVLNVVEYFMQQIDQHNGEAGLENFVGPWRKNEDYYRLDGSTPKDRRPSMINNFNDENNKRTKVLLISTEAGGQGINLFGANRLILLDTSWNPSKDQQSIFRIYRMGQNKQCYIYRLLSMGTMEEKIYSRSVTKQAMSCRVVDKQQIDRHFSMSELDELYSLTKTDMAKRVAPIPPRDDLLAHLLRKYPNMIYKYLEHDSLLANKVEEELNDIEKSEAWRRCQEQNLQMQALNNLMANGEPTATPFKLHKEMLPALELKNRSVVNMGKKAVYSQHNKENVSFGNEMAGHISANTIDMEHELADDKLSSLSDDAQMDVQPSLWRSNSYKWLPPSNATGTESSNDDTRVPLLSLESFENRSNGTIEVKEPISSKIETEANDDIKGPLLSIENFETRCDDTIKVESHSQLAIAKLADGVGWSTDDVKGPLLPPENFENGCDDTIKEEAEEPHLSIARDVFEPNLLLNRSFSASSKMELPEFEANSPSDNPQINVQKLLQRSDQWPPASNATEPNVLLNRPLSATSEMELSEDESNSPPDNPQRDVQKSLHGTLPAAKATAIKSSNRDAQEPRENFENCCGNSIEVGAEGPLLAIAKIATFIETSNDDSHGPLVTLGNFGNGCDNTLKVEAERPHLESTQDVFLSRSSSASNEVELSENAVNSFSDEAHFSSDEVHSSSDEAHFSSDEAHSSSDEAHFSSDEAHSSFDEAHSSFDEAQSSFDEAHSSFDEAHSSSDETHSSSDESSSLQRSNSREWHAPSNASGIESSNRDRQIPLENFENCCGDIIEEQLPAIAKISTTTETSNDGSEGLLLPLKNFGNGCNDSIEVGARDPHVAIAKDIFEPNVSLNRASSASNEMELSEDEANSPSDNPQIGVQTSLQRSNSYELLPSSNEIATGIEPNDDLRGPLLPLETFENGSNDSHDDIQENVYNIDGEVERRSRSAAADKKVFKLNGNLNGNEPEQAIQQTDTEPSVERSNSCVWLAASHAASLDDTKRALTLNNVDNRSNDSSNHDIQRRPLEKGNHNNLDGGVERSLTDIVKGLLHTLNNKYAASSQQPYSLEDYTIEEQILLPNEFDNLEYRIALKRPSSGGIHRPIKRLKLSLEIDPVAALPLTTECPMDVIMENPQSQHADGNVGFPNLNGENEDVCSNSAQQSEFVTDPAPTEYVENNFNADIDTNEVIVMTNGSEGKVSVRSEGTLLDDEDEDIFHADVDPDEVIVTANGSEGKESDSVRVEVAFPDDDSTSDDEEKCSDSVQQSKELVTDLAPTESYEDIFNADVDSDEVIAKTSGSEGKQPIFVRVERTFPVDIEDDDEMSPIESTEPINLNDLSHNDEPAGDDFMSSDEYMEKAVAPTHSYGQINCIQSENEQDSGSSDGDDLHDVQFYEEQPSTMSKIVERCALM